MNRIWLFVAIPVLLLGVFQPSSESLGQSGLQKLGTVDGWNIRGADGHCQAGYAMRSGLTQFAVGMAPDGSFMTLQNIGWKLRANSRNMMRVTVEFDGERAFRTEALVIAMVGAVQIFVDLTDMSDADFWTHVLSAKSMQVKGKFGNSSSISVDLEGVEATLPLLRDCADQFLPEITVPF